MRILLTADTVGGVWTYAIELAAALRQRGAEVLLATMGQALSPDQRRQAHALDNVQVHESTYRLEWMDEPWDDVHRAGQWLLDLEQRHRPDLVHLNGYAHGALPWQSPLLVVAHSCVLSWFQAVKRQPAGPSWERYRRAVQAGLRGADLIVAPSWAMLCTLQQHYGPLGPTRIIYNGRDASTFPPTRKEPCILAAGRLWDEAKNLAALDAVAPRLAWPVYVAGNQRHPDGRDLPCAHAHPLGALAPDDLAAWYSRAAIYALPARYEPFGLSILEAALSCCALVLGDIPSLREIWGDCAVYVPPESPAALEEAITDLIDHRRRRWELAEAARHRAQWFTAERMADGYWLAYDQTLKRTRPLADAPPRPLAPWPFPPEAWNQEMTGRATL